MQMGGSHVAVIDILQVSCADAHDLSAGTGGLLLSLGSQLCPFVLGRRSEQEVTDAAGEAAALQEYRPQPAQAAQQISCCSASIQLLQPCILSISSKLDLLRASTSSLKALRRKSASIHILMLPKNE